MTVPPYDSNGRGTPIIGSRPVTIDVFNNTYKNKFTPTPTEINLPKTDLD